MKKILLAGALAASMLASSAAFAADLTVGVSEDKLYVTADTDAAMTANAGKQMTVVVVDGDGTTVTTDTIRYIDQDAAAAGLFESMGVLLREGETELPADTYTVKIGGEGITDLYVGTFEIKEDAAETFTIKWGDVNNDNDVSVGDATAILMRNVAGGTVTFGDYTIGEDYGTIKWGDVNNDKDVSVGDATAILMRNVAGGTVTFGDYTIGEDYTFAK